MSRQRPSSDTAPKGRGTALPETGVEAMSAPVPRLVPRRQTHREKNETAATDHEMLLAVASSPMVHEMGKYLRELLAPPNRVGGRPRSQPYWAMAVFLCSMGFYGSSSNAARHLRKPSLWKLVVDAAAPLIDGSDVPVTDKGPSRDHYMYLAKRLDDLGDDVSERFEELAADLFTRIHASVTGVGGHRSNKPYGHTTMGLDGKVFDSPQAHNLSERIDRKTGEVKPVRVDPARGSWHEGGGKEVVIGNKFAFGSSRLGWLQNARIIFGVGVPEHDGRGEAGSFVDLAKRACGRMPFLNTLVIDGAMRGQAISEIQMCTGAAVVSPPRRKDRQHGGYRFDGTYYAGKRLPDSASRRRAFADCGGHDLHAFAGSVFEANIASDGTMTCELVERGQEKRQRRPDGSWYFSAQHRLPCQETGSTHSWWESMTPTDDDRAAKFNRNEYLRNYPITGPDHKIIYRDRADTESFHAQVEQAFHKRRLPAWGAKRQRLVMIFTCLAYNAWAESIWRNEIERQTQDPPAAA